MFLFELQNGYNASNVTNSAYLQMQQQQQLGIQQQILLQQQQQQELLLRQEQQRLLLQNQQLQQQQMLSMQSMARSPTPADMFSAGMSASGGYQMRSMLLSKQEQQMNSSSHQGRLTSVSSGASLGGGLAVPNLMAAEEIRVDCIQLTTNGRFVVTGSIYGPPQMWDLKVSGSIFQVYGLERLVAY